MRGIGDIKSRVDDTMNGVGRAGLLNSLQPHCSAGSKHSKERVNAWVNER